ncbi:E3 ubiquitin-protein ligase siah-1 [Gonioctena quinquepunctata]|nr:E3 ubiquitin-protein ligase siah-1 [Gonioctena quinquepunctata]
MFRFILNKMEVSTNDLILTEEIVKQLKCSLCNLYLSFPPVYIISMEDAKYKCARCTVHTRFRLRASMYENLAKFMKFPCIYKNCTEKLAWEEVREHERDCEHRTLLCIVSDCNENVLQKEFASHFKEKHTKYYCSNNVSRENIHNKCGLAVLEKDGKCYVIFYDTDQDKFRIGVCSLETPDKQFDLVITSKEKHSSIVVTEQNIMPFNEKSHCYKCLVGECKIEYHVHKYNRKGLLKYVGTKVDRDLIRFTFGNSVITCTINIVEEKAEATEDEIDELLLGKDVIIDEVNDEEETEKVPVEEENSALNKMLQCPGCEEQMAPPIFECLAGHTMCNSCKAKAENDKCTTCEAQIENTRNYILEEVVANLKLADQEKSNEAETEAVEITCPMSKCTEKIKLNSISNHFKETHITNFHFNKLDIKDVYGYYNIDVLVKDNRTYLVFFDFDDSVFGMSVCSLEPDRRRFEVKLLSENKKYAVVSTNQKIISFDDKEHCAKCSKGVCKIADHTFRQKRKALFRRLTTKLPRDCIRRTFKCSSLSFEITILDAQDSPTDKIFRQLFECPICKDYMVPPIHQCVAGHTLCNVCKTKLEKCPSCEGKIEDTRNHFLEKIADTVELPCVKLRRLKWILLKWIQKRH